MRLPKKYMDRDGRKLTTEDLYRGYRPGLYKVVEPGETISLVKKIFSGKGVPIRKPKEKQQSNYWLRLSKKEY